MATIYIQNFDQSQTVSTLGNITYDASNADSEGHVKLSATIPVATLGDAFKFKSQGSDFTEESAQVQYVTGQNIVHELYSTSSGDAATKLYENSTPGPKLDFLQQLAKEVFGSTNAVDLFSNEQAVADAYEASIIAAAEAVNAIATSSAYVYLDESNSNGLQAQPGSAETEGAAAEGQLVSSSATQTGARGAIDVLNALLANFKERFELAYTVSTTSGKTIAATGDLTNQATNTYLDANGNAGSGDGTLRLNFNFNTAGDTVEQVTIHTAGSGYAAGDVLTFVDTNNGSNNSITMTLRETDLNMINGADNFVDMPIIASDKIQMLFTISSHANQTDASGDACSISRKCLVEITAV